MLDTPVARSLGKKAAAASAWNFLNFGGSQALRLAANLALTRLLFPEAFGLMAIVQAVLIGATLLSDVGIQTSIVQHPNGTNPSFLNTAFTMQAMRGVVIWLVICALSWFFANTYNQPSLVYLLPVSGFSAVIAGLTSMSISIADRALSAKATSLLELGATIFGLLITIVLAYLLQSVWALVWGALSSTAFRTVLSHLIFKNAHQHRFEWNLEAKAAILKISRWILLGSAITFLAGEGLKLLLAAKLTPAELAFFTIASTLVLVFPRAIQQLAGKVFFPLYSTTWRDTPKQLQRTLLKARGYQLLLGLPITATLAFAGSSIVNALYDTRYEAAGTWLQYLALGQFPGLIRASYSGILFAKNAPQLETLNTCIQIPVQVTGVFWGYHLAGPTGSILGLVAADWLLYLPTAWTYHRVNSLQLNIDLPLLTLGAFITGWVLWSTL